MRRHSSYLLWPLLVATVALFCVRGLYRGIRPHVTNDFFSVYSISRAWVAGEAPYSTAVIVRTFQDASGYKLGRNTLVQAENYSALPSMVPIAAPFSMLRWRAANLVFVVFSILVLGLMLWMLARISGASRSDVLVFFICCLALGPIHTGLSGSNVTPLLVGLMGLSYLLMRQGRSVPAGILLGVVGCCKPHIAGALVLVLLVDREWKTLRVAVLTGIASVAIFAGRLAALGVPWWSDFLQPTRRFGVVGDANDFSLANPSRYELTNLQVVLGSITSSRGLANFIAITAGLVLVAAWWIAVRRNGRSNLLAFAAINVILLLPSYHRFYDASVLIFLFAAVFLEPFQRCLRTTAIATAILFAFPVPAGLVYVAEANQIPRGLLASMTFQVTCLAVNVWFLLVISVILVIACHNPSRFHSPHCRT